jgi:CheY-like chemotaxis protein
LVASLILTVENNPITASGLRDLLQGSGYRVVLAGAGKEALSIVEVQRPDLILLDLSLPDTSGFDLLPRLSLRLGLPKVPVVACSGFLSFLDETRVLYSGFSALLHKPIEPSLLLDAVSTYLAPARSADLLEVRPTVLVVDDTEVSLKLLSYSLEQQGFRVERASDGMAALEALKRMRPNAIVTDTLMPRLDGFRLCQEVRSCRTLSQIPVVMHSESYDEEEDRALAYAAGADAFVVRKSAAFDEVIEALVLALGVPTRAPDRMPADQMAARHIDRLTRQLERQQTLNAQLTRRCAVQSAAMSCLDRMATVARDSHQLERGTEVILATCLDAVGTSRGAVYERRDESLILTARIGFDDVELAAVEKFFGHLDWLEKVRQRGDAVLVPGPEAPAALASTLKVVSGCQFLLIIPLGGGDSSMGVLITGSEESHDEAVMSLARAMGGQLAQAFALTAALSHLRASEQRQSLILSGLPVCLYARRSDDQGLSYVSDNSLRLTGFSAAKMLEPGFWLSRLHRSDVENVLRALTEIANSGQCNVEYRWMHADGDYRWFVDTARLSTVAGTDEIVGTWTDVSEQKKLEAQLLESQKMDALGILAGGVAHDFNNIITAINGYSELAIMSLPEDSPLQEYLKEIAAAGDRASGLTRQLLTFSRREVTEVKLLDLNAVVSEVQKMLRRTIGEDIHMTVSLQPSLPPILADKGHLEQILLNLSVNARDAMPRGGKLDISTRSVTLLDGREQVELSVADSSCGMEPHVLAKVFEPFFTTKDAGKGTGLGLSTVYGIVQQHKGTIAIESEVGLGTTFRIQFAAQQGGDTDVKVSAAKRDLHSGRETILLVEDDKYVRAMARHVLASSGYKLLECVDGVEGWETFRTHAASIDLVLTDSVMPRMGGVELLGLIFEQRPDMKVLMMSGYTDDSLARYGIDPRRMAFLPKPFSPQSLSRGVRETSTARPRQRHEAPAGR